MKKHKLLLILIIAAIVGFALVSCDDPAELQVSHIHDFGEWHTILYATCTEEGIRALRCTGCNTILYTTVANVLGHNMIATDNVLIAPTCEDDGFGEAVCSREDCEHTQTAGLIPALGHAPGNWVLTTLPTCTEDGEETGTCTRDGCDHTNEPNVIEKLGHNMITTDNVYLYPTCEDDGFGEAACTRDGCDHTQTARVISALGHIPGNWVQTTLPTCTEDGIETGTCTRDGCSHPNEPRSGEPALGHIFDEWVAPTCTQDGNSTRTCTRNNCNHADTRTTGYAALGHNMITTDNVYIAPTCEEDGFGEAVCTNEGCEHTQAEGLIPALGHVPGNWAQTTLPTCTAAGIETGTCTRPDCNHPNVPRTGTPALGHVPGNWVQTTPPTCTAAGIETGTCTRSDCNHPNEPRTSAPALGHVWGDWVRPAGNITSLTAIQVTRTCSHNTTADCTQTRTISLSEYLATYTQQTEPIFLPLAINLGIMGTANNDWTQLLIALNTANKQVALDLSASTMSGGAFNTGNPHLGPRAGMNTIVSIVLPSITTSIGNQAFDGVTSLASVTFAPGSQLQAIYGAAFRNTALTSITIPASVTSIGTWAFGNATNLASVTFAPGSQLQTIGEAAFMNTALTNITIPASVTYIGGRAFANTNAIFSLASGSVLSVIDNGRGLVLNNRLIAYSSASGNIILPTWLIEIGSGAFSNTNITSIEIPASVGSIGHHAFENTANLTSVTFAPDSQLQTIGNNAFMNTALTSIEIPASVRFIGHHAFENATNLTSVTFASASDIWNTRPITIGNSAFRNTALTSITIPSTANIGSGTFRDVTSLTNVTFAPGSQFPNQYIHINEFAFQNTAITSITIPANVLLIGSGAFMDITSLISVTVLRATPTLVPMSSTAFNNTHPNLQIKVPAGGVEAYRTAWGPLLPAPGASRIVAIP